jgi:hypothetical protein
MATTIRPAAGADPADHRFFLGAALAMAATVAAGFGYHLALGRSSFSAPPLVHAHAIVFMGWVGFYVLQTALAGRGVPALHRRLGWLALGWLPLMLGLGLAVTVAMVRDGRTPPDIQPQQFLIFNPLTLLGFIACVAAAIGLRRRTDWHRRLQLTGMAMIIGTAIGRMLPGPSLVPHAFDAEFAAGMIFPLAGAFADWRRCARVHPAWLAGLAAMLAVWGLANAISFSPLGARIYAAVTAGTPGAAIPGLGFSPPPA